MEDQQLTSLPSLSESAVRLLVSRQTLDIFDVVGDEALSIKEISDTLGSTLKEIWYLVRQLTNAGLLMEAGLRPRKGRAQKLYRVRAQSFFIPADVRMNTVGRRLGTALLDSLEYNDDALGERFYFDGARWRVEKVQADIASRNHLQEEIWMLTEISPDEANNLVADIRSVFEKYRKKQARADSRTLVHFAFAPFS